jgi:hypothetical protein
MTPEGRVKKNIKRVLDAFGVYYLMPVQFGIGAAGIDFHCVVEVIYIIDAKPTPLAIAFFIEAKAPGEEPTGRQENFMRDRREQQSAKTFVIDDDPTINKGMGNIEELTEWLEAIESNNEHIRTAYGFTR